MKVNIIMKEVHIKIYHELTVYFLTALIKSTMSLLCHVTIRSWKLPERTFIMTFTEQEMWIVLFLQVSIFISIKRKSETVIVWLFLAHNESLIASKAN